MRSDKDKIAKAESALSRSIFLLKKILFSMPKIHLLYKIIAFLFEYIGYYRASIKFFCIFFQISRCNLNLCNRTLSQLYWNEYNRDSLSKFLLHSKKKFPH